MMRREQLQSSAKMLILIAVDTQASLARDHQVKKLMKESHQNMRKDLKIRHLCSNHDKLAAKACLTNHIKLVLKKHGKLVMKIMRQIYPMQASLNVAVSALSTPNSLVLKALYSDLEKK